MSTTNNNNFDVVRSELKDTVLQAFQEKKVDLLTDKIRFYKNTEIETKPPLDQAFRDVLLDLLEKESKVALLKDYIDFSIQTSRAHLNNATIPVVLLGDIFDTLPLDTCQDLFTFVEDNVQVWKEELFFTSCKNNLLRLCNDLLRRLSRTTATVFCGKILLFLAKFFPFSERSGLNIVSEFNLENITEYGADASDDIVTEIQSGDQKHVIDFTFYCKFWQLQDFFRNPNQCYDKVQWKLFCLHSMNILNTFQGIKLDYVTSDNYGNVGYFAKYLTSQKLLDLQLHDVSFRRSVLLQFLITFQYLTSSVKFKSDNYELKADQKEWIQNASTKIYNLLKETPPDGENFAVIVKNVLSREELWNSWKNDGCPEIKKLLPQNQTDPEEVAVAEPTQPLLGDLIKESHEKGQYYMGSTELTKLWNLCPDNLESCKGKDRDFLPSLEEYFADAITQIETPLKDQESLLKDSNFGWRALRLLARRSSHFFTYSNTIMNPLSSYLEMMVKKIAHERPGRQDENSLEGQKEEEMEEGLITEENATEELKPNDAEDFIDDKNPRKEDKQISEEKWHEIVEKIAPDWEKLAMRLGFSQEIDFFKTENATRVEQAIHMIRLWFDDDEDANFDNLLYILEGLEMKEAAEALKNELGVSIDM